MRSRKSSYRGLATSGRARGELRLLGQRAEEVGSSPIHHLRQMREAVGEARRGASKTRARDEIRILPQQLRKAARACSAPKEIDRGMTAASIGRNARKCGSGRHTRPTLAREVVDERCSPESQPRMSAEASSAWRKPWRRACRGYRGRPPGREDEPRCLVPPPGAPSNNVGSGVHVAQMGEQHVREGIAAGEPRSAQTGRGLTVARQRVVCSSATIAGDARPAQEAIGRRRDRPAPRRRSSRHRPAPQHGSVWRSRSSG